MSVHLEYSFHFVSQEPKISNKYDHLLRPFNWPVWSAVVACLILFSTMFYLTYHTYSSEHLFGQKLHSNGFSYYTFPLYTLTKVKNPAPLPWFHPKKSTGRLLTFEYTVFCFLLVVMYLSNLQAHLVAVGYEKPVDTMQDVIDNKLTPWIMKEMGHFS